MPTPSDPDKAYIKKHKLNDLLNELFLSLKQNKPDDPINFAYNHFKSKLPNPPPSPHAANDPNLLTKLFSKQHEALNTSQTNKTNVSKASSLRALSTYQIVTKVDRVLAKNLHQETAEDLLENEMIVTSGQNESVEAETRKIVKYKSSLEKKDTQGRHRKDLEKLLLNEIAKKETLSTAVKEASTMPLNEDYEALLFDEVALEGSSRRYRSNENEVNKVKERKVDKVGDMNRMNRFLSSTAPTPKVTVICKVCAQIQLEALPEEKAPVQLASSKDILGGLFGKTVEKINTMVGKEVINAGAVEEKKYSQAASNIFDLLHLSDKKEAGLEPVTVKDTARTNATNGDGDDEFIESASQVSGPRPIENYNPLTNRDETQPKSELPALTQARDPDNSVMSWLLNTSKQQAGQPSGDEATGLLVLQPATVNKPGSTAGSAALSEKTLNEEMWNQKNLLFK